MVTQEQKARIRKEEFRKHSNTYAFFATVIIAAIIVFIIFSAALAHHKKTVANRERTINREAMDVSQSVLEYEELIRKHAKKYGIEEYAEYLMAIMEVESGGYSSTDVMQASESAELPMDTLTEEDSIEQGCLYLSQLLDYANEKQCDLNTVIQSYNYGKGFIDYVAQRGRKYTFELAEAFAKEQSGGATVAYSNEIAVEENGGWRYRYGNMFYVPLVEQYVSELKILEGS